MLGNIDHTRNLSKRPSENLETYLRRLQRVYYGTNSQRDRRRLLPTLKQAHLMVSLEYLCRLEGGSHFRSELSHVDQLSASLTRLRSDFELVFDPDSEEKWTMSECVICMEAFEPYQQIVRMPDCLHYFHADCCQQWFTSHSTVNWSAPPDQFNGCDKRCPLCNQKLDLYD